MNKTQILKGKMTMKNLTQKQTSELMKMGTTAFNYKLNNINRFTVEELQVLCKILDLTEEEKKEIFF